MDNVQKAMFSGELKVGDITMACAVLEDGTRVLSERAIAGAIGSKRGGAHWRRVKELAAEGEYLPVYISATNLKPFISEELSEALKNPTKYKLPTGGAVANGLEAGLLPQICEVWLKARDNNQLHPSQCHIASQADILMRGLAHIGIIALIDEATGYQDVRDRQALERILEKFISKELLSWTQQFPNDFYKEIFRLKGWHQPLTGKRPGVVGYYTNDLVYDRLAPGILEELKRLTPRTETGRRKHRFHQYLTREVGHPKLSEHLSNVIVLMKASTSWESFLHLINRACPKFGSSVPLFETDEE